MAAPRFETYQDKAGQFRWRFISSNGKIIAMSSESYKAKADCKNGIELIRRDAAKCPIEEKK